MTIETTRAFDIITFDCYGTLIDWENGIAEAFLQAARLDGLTLSRHDILHAYHQLEPVVERDRYLPYRQVLAETALRVAAALGWPLAADRAAFLADSLPNWTPFADTNGALERLRGAGFRLGILSNIDDDLLAATRRHFTVDFDLIITAQQVGSYKPAPGHFLAAKERIGDARWLHAAQSNFHDVVPVNAMGIPTAWVNRGADTPLPGGAPTYDVRDMAALADLLTS
jgi:2-haloalkanoic acid dehalogenase type II